MGQEGSLAVIATFIAFGVLTLLLYFLVLRPILPNEATADGGVGAARTNADTNNQNGRGTRRVRVPEGAGGATAAAAGGGGGGGGSGQNNKEDGNIDRVLAECATFPVHCAPGSQNVSRAGGSNLLVDGLLAFRHTRAAAYEQSKASSNGREIATQNRKDRARILSRMLMLEEGSSDSSSPPHRGSTIVLSIPAAEISCRKLRRILYLFGTYYNLLVIIVVPADKTAADDLKKLTLQLRGNDDDTDRLEAEVLPDHRIVAASTATGRVAFCRQLSRIEIVLDFDNDVEAQLSRFGYRVINYKKQLTDKKMSQLGSQLLS